MNRIQGSTSIRWLVLVTLLVALVAGGWWYLNAKGTWQRGEALAIALQPTIDGKNEEKALVARVILNNYRETRGNAVRWSGVYWGFTFTAAIFSALATLILKLESFIRNDSTKKDLAAALSVTAALLITISTGGDFQRKWQANRVAAAEIESTGYKFLEKNGENARSYLDAIGRSMLKRQLFIVGSTQQTDSAQELLVK